MPTPFAGGILVEPEWSQHLSAGQPGFLVDRVGLDSRIERAASYPKANAESEGELLKHA